MPSTNGLWGISTGRPYRSPPRTTPSDSLKPPCVYPSGGFGASRARQELAPARTVLDLPRPSEGRRKVPENRRWSAAGSRLAPGGLTTAYGAACRAAWRLGCSDPGVASPGLDRDQVPTIEAAVRGLLQGRRTTPRPPTVKSPEWGMNRRRRGGRRSCGGCRRRPGSKSPWLRSRH
jgi:hypothetical protein